MKIIMRGWGQPAKHSNLNTALYAIEMTQTIQLRVGPKDINVK